MATTRAIVITGSGKDATEIQTVPVPKLRDEYILVRTTAVGLNPTDWKSATFHQGPLVGSRSGCDYAGEVLEVGSGVTNGIKKGDKVCGVIHGARVEVRDSGAFSEIASAKGNLQIKKPTNLSDEQAATLGIGITTVGQSLYQFLKLPLPWSPAKTAFPVLIYGGSTATGILAIQYAKLSGLTVLTTSSPHNFEYLKSLGADAVFDYNSPSAVADIKAYVAKNGNGQPLKHVMDCIAEEKTAKFSAAVLEDAPEGSIYGALLPPKKELFTNKNVETGNTLAYTVFGEPFNFLGSDLPAIEENYDFGVKFWAEAKTYIEAGKIKVAKTDVNKFGSGLEGVVKGLEYLASGKVSGSKLVVTMP